MGHASLCCPNVISVTQRLYLGVSLMFIALVGLPLAPLIPYLWYMYSTSVCCHVSFTKILIEKGAYFVIILNSFWVYYVHR